MFACRQRAMCLFVTQLVALVLAALVLRDRVPIGRASIWLGAVALTAIIVTFNRLRAPPPPDQQVSLTAMRRTTWEGLALGLCWVAGPLWFDAQLGQTGIVLLWTILAVLAPVVALSLAPLTMSAVALIGVVALPLVLQLALYHDPVAALAVLLFTALLVSSVMGRARALAQSRLVQLTLTDREETVSMLLGEIADTEGTSSDWLWEIDANRRIIRASPRFAYACGIDPTAINGMSFLQILAGPGWENGDFSPELRQVAEKIKNRESFRGLALPVIIGGEQRWWEITASPRFDGNDRFCGFRGVGSDITQQRESEARINHLARFDALTGLPNRLLVNEALARALAEAEKWRARCAFMMIDLDRFKAVNDTLGHPVGDRLLGLVSQRLAKLMTENELIGRLGGDEFAVVMREVNATATAEDLARTIIDTLSQPYEIDQHTLYIGASVGMAVSPRDGRTAETLIRSADLALYRSKDRGGGVFHAYEPQLHSEAEERRVLEMSLRRALEKGQLHLVYQPVVNAHDGALRSFEALLRWNHPEIGPVSPAKFIPIAEEARLIGPIGDWVVRTACEEAARWPSDIRVAVNVSPTQLHNPQFTTVVASALANSRLAPSRLDLEVTESVFLREGTGATRILDQVLEMGVGLSLDDFGTGYSSLGYLGKTRFSSIKIDRSFTQAAAAGSAEAIAIIRAVVALATSLDMATVAEGVESEAELHMIQQLGCTRIQGFYFGRPLPVMEARALAARHDRAMRAA
jgi:diguanylate cyclase (GGDEF)-like protein/PAS domain S-box-containing protein